MMIQFLWAHFAFVIILVLSVCNVNAAIAVILWPKAEQPTFCTFHHCVFTYLRGCLLHVDLDAFHVFFFFVNSVFLLHNAVFLYICASHVRHMHVCDSLRAIAFKLSALRR